jgi:Flp pilus assembly protein TadG
MTRRFAREDGGQAVVLVAIMFMTLLFFVGLALDTGNLSSTRRRMQEAADSAAFGGAVALYQGATTAQAIAAARADAATNGYTNAGTTQVVVNSPPLAGAFISDPKYVEVIISLPVSTNLLPKTLTTVTTRGVGGAAPTVSGDALLALNPTAFDAIMTEGNGGIRATGGDIMSDSSNGTAVEARGSGRIAATSPRKVLATGGFQAGCCTPTPVAGVARHADPLAGFPMPACPAGSSNCTVYQPCCTSPLNPGVYSSINVGGTDVVMNPGIYIIRGGGVHTGANGALRGTGVTIFVTTTSYPGVGTSCSGTSISGDGGFSLSAPTSGTYKGMAYFQDPSCAASFVIEGNGSTLSATGTFYMPKAKLYMQSNGDFTAHSRIIVDTIDISGNGNLNVTYNASENAAPIVPALSE